MSLGNKSYVIICQHPTYGEHLYQCSGKILRFDNVVFAVRFRDELERAEVTRCSLEEINRKESGLPSADPETTTYTVGELTVIGASYVPA